MKMQMQKSRYILSLISILMLGCDVETESPASVTLDAPKSVSEAIARWHSWNIHDYSFTQTRRCWYSWCGDSMRVVVRADTIYLISILSHSAFDTAWGLTVDRLFEIAQLDTSRWSVQAEFDEIYGFPRGLSCQIKPPPYTEGGVAYLTFDFVQ